MTQFNQNLLLTVFLLGAVAYCVYMGKVEVALAMVGIITALWRHGGRDHE
jgi:uncharacterized membrane protein